MDKYNFEWEAEAEEYDKLFHRGKLLHEEINALDEDDLLVIDDFLEHLSPFEEKAFKIYDEYLYKSGAYNNKGTNNPSTEDSSKESSGKKLTELLEKFIIEKSRNWGEKQSASTEHKDYRPKIGLFIEIVGDVYSNELTRENVASYKETIFELPRNKSKMKEYRDKSISELLAMKIQKEDKLSNTTIKNNFSKVSTFLKWCEGNGHTTSNLTFPLANVIKSTKTAQQERDIFTEQDLQRLFMNDDYQRLQFKYASQYWVPLIALFTGARLTEICQLYVDDIKKVGDIWIFDINDNEDKKLKNLYSERQIPIHSTLIKTLHFIDYVNSLKTKKNKRLFEDLNDSQDGYGGNLSKWFTRYRRKMKVGIEASENKTFHSFRHTFMNYYKQQRTEEFQVSEYVGQRPKSGMAYVRYAKKDSIIQAKEFIELLKFDFLDFSKIRQWRV